jgi:hypothetical protein
MNSTTLYTRISTLPSSIQNELMDYMEFLIQKYKPKKVKKHPKAGCMQGTFKISSDFNFPLEDFKEYMQ